MRKSLLVLVAVGMVAVGMWVSAAWAAPAGGGTVYVATGENFPDAVTAGAAGGSAGGPVLLVRRNSIPSPTLSELNRLQPFLIVIVGGTAVISQGVEDQLEGLSFAPVVVRKGGADRYETAALLSHDSFPGLGADSCHGYGFFPASSSFEWSSGPNSRFHDNPGSTSFFCELSIEHGSTLTKFTASIDDKASLNAPCHLKRVDLTGAVFGIGAGDSETIASTPSTTGSSGPDVVSTTTISEPRVDNSRYAYYAMCQGAPDFRIIGVAVEYEIVR